VNLFAVARASSAWFTARRPCHSQTRPVPVWRSTFLKALVVMPSNFYSITDQLFTIEDCTKGLW